MEEDPTLKYICFDCSEELDEAYNFQQKCAKSVTTNSLAEKRFKNHRCSIALDHAKALKKYKSKHSTDALNHDGPSRAVQGSAVNTQKNRIQSPNFKFKIPNRPSQSKVTSATHHANKPIQADTSEFQCSICHLTFKAQSALSTHFKWHGIKKKQYKCPHCGLVFLNSLQRNKHVKLSHEEGI